MRYTGLESHSPEHQEELLPTRIPRINLQQQIKEDAGLLSLPIALPLHLPR